MDFKYESGDNKILHDEYFGKKPAAAYLLTVRALLLCVMTASYVILFCQLYGYRGGLLIPAAAAAGASGIIYILASLFPAAIVYFTVLAATAGTIWIMRSEMLTRALYLWDHMMLTLDSRLIKTTGFFAHDEERIRKGLAQDLKQMDTAMMTAVILLAVLLAVIFTAAVRTRPHISVLFITAVVIAAPAVAAESAGFLPVYIPIVMCIFGFEAICSSYELDIGFIYGTLSSGHYSQRSSDHTYHKRARFKILAKKAELDTTRYHRYSSNLIAAAIVTGLVFWGASAVIPEGQGINYQQVFEKLEDFGYRIADTFGNVFGTTFGQADNKGYFTGDETYGDISNSISIAPPSSSDRPVIEVTLSRNDVPVYLRGDIGVNYENNSWSSIRTSDEYYKSFVSQDFYPETEYQVFRLALAANGYSPEDAMPLQMVSTRYLRNTKVVFQPLAPYELNYRTNPQYENIGDFVLRTRNGFVKSYECLSLTPTITMPDFTLSGVSGSDHGRYIATVCGYTTDELVSRRAIPAADMDNDIYIDNISRYRSFIHSEYMNVTEDVEDFVFNDLFPYIAKTYTADIYSSANTYAYEYSSAICSYFKDNFTYSLDVDNGIDQLDSFLHKTHRGHCALFATAMTLALRELGIPARYVTGYVAEGISEKVADGYKYTLTERQLHAWTEVYFNGIGWLPFDPTAAVPGYAEIIEGSWDGKGEYEKPAETEPAVSETSVTSAPITSSAAETSAPATNVSSDDTTAVNPAGPGGSDPAGSSEPGILELILTRYLYIVIIAAVVIVVTIIAIVFVNRLKKSEKKVLKSFNRLPPFEACSVMYRFVLTLLSKNGIVPGTEQFYDFAQRVDSDTLLKGSNVFMMDVMPVFEKCEFGNPEVSPVTQDEREAVRRFTAAVYVKVMSSFSPLKRFFVKISLFL